MMVTDSVGVYEIANVANVIGKVEEMIKFQEVAGSYGLIVCEFWAELNVSELAVCAKTFTVSTTMML